MNNYIKFILKPFDLTNMRADIAAILASVPTILTAFSKDHLGMSGALFGVLFVLIVADFWTGVAAARKLKITLTSKKGRKTLYKSGAYLVFIYAAHHLHQEFIDITIVKTIIMYLHVFLIAHVTFWELFSIDENLKKLGINLGITDPLKAGYANLKNVLKLGSKKER